MSLMKYPEPTVGALIISSREKILLLKSQKWKNKYVLPGGHIEHGETAQDALRREVKEETGLEIFGIESLGYQDCIFPDTFWQEKHFLFLDFACKTEEAQVFLNKEAQDYVWVSLKEALDLNIEPHTRKAIKKFIERQNKVPNNRINTDKNG
jgi:nucleoside triphosphatase